MARSSIRRRKLRSLITYLTRPILYILLLLLLSWTISRNGFHDQHSFYFTNLISDRFINEEFVWPDTTIKKTWKDIGETSEFWLWLEGPLLNAIKTRILINETHLTLVEETLEISKELTSKIDKQIAN